MVQIPFDSPVVIDLRAIEASFEVANRVDTAGDVLARNYHFINGLISVDFADCV